MSCIAVSVVGARGVWQGMSFIELDGRTAGIAPAGELQEVEGLEGK